MRKLIIFCLVLSILPIANAVCTIPEDGIVVRENTSFCYGAYEIKGGINVAADGVVVECNNSVLTGNGIGYGILLRDRRDVVVKNCTLSNYEVGIYMESTNNSIIRSNHLAKNKFGIALFNSFSNSLNNNSLYENLRGNSVNYLSAPFIAAVEGQPKTEKKEEASSPQKVIEEIIRIKKPFLEEAEIFSEVDSILAKHFSITRENLGIERTIQYNESDKSTRIVLQLMPKKVLLNLSVYEKIPKCITTYVNNLLIETGGYEVVQNDPLILWSFSRLDSSRAISYKVFKRIDEECKELLLAFGIASGVEEQKGGKESGGMAEGPMAVFFVVTVLSLLLYAAFRMRRK